MSSFDVLLELSDHGLEYVVLSVLEQLDSLDLKTCELVSKGWQRLVRSLWDHHEFKRVGRGWAKGEPSVVAAQCKKERVDKMDFFLLSILTCGKTQIQKKVLFVYLAVIVKDTC
jgi:hypothetical protein